MSSQGKRIIVVILAAVLLGVTVLAVARKFSPDFLRTNSSGLAIDNSDLPVRTIGSDDPNSTPAEHNLTASDVETSPRYMVVDRSEIAAGARAEAADFDLSNVSSVVELDDGRLITYSSIGATLLLFDESGNGEKVLGTIGEGPG